MKIPFNLHPFLRRSCKATPIKKKTKRDTEANRQRERGRERERTKQIENIGNHEAQGGKRKTTL